MEDGEEEEEYAEDYMMDLDGADESEEEEEGESDKEEGEGEKEEGETGSESDSGSSSGSSSESDLEITKMGKQPMKKDRDDLTLMRKIEFMASK